MQSDLHMLLTQAPLQLDDQDLQEIVLESPAGQRRRIDVEVGQRVAQGEVIGAIGATGRVTGAHLDWRMNWFERRLDPALLVEPQK